MARFKEPTQEQLDGWAEWCASRPEHVRKIAERFDPWSLYRLKPGKDRVTIHSFDEELDGGRVTLKVMVLADFNLTLFERTVFGVDPDSLEPCDLPAEDEPLGALMTPEAVHDNMDTLRAIAAASKASSN